MMARKHTEMLNKTVHHIVDYYAKMKLRDMTDFGVNTKIIIYHNLQNYSNNILLSVGKTVDFGTPQYFTGFNRPHGLKELTRSTPTSEIRVQNMDRDKDIYLWKDTIHTTT